jgi:uncharacterized protein (TIGR00251 family)
MNIKDYIKKDSLKIVVKPNAKKNELLDYDESRKAVKVAIAAQAEKGKANIEVIKFFSKLLGKPVKIKSGLTSKEKLLKIS